MVGCYYNYGPGFEDPLDESICNITSKVYGNEGLHKNVHIIDPKLHYSKGGGICNCEDGTTYLVGERTLGNLACNLGHDGGVTLHGPGDHSNMMVTCKKRPSYIVGYLATISAKLMCQLYPHRLKIIIKMNYDADQEVFIPRGTENHINLSFSLYVTNIFAKTDLEAYAKAHGQYMVYLNFTVLFGITGIVFGMFVYRIRYLIRRNITGRVIIEKQE
jgi:hypothetical protein